MTVKEEIVHGSVAVSFCVLWIFLSWSGLTLRDRPKQTDEMLRVTDRLIQTHIRSWGEMPVSLNELRLFAKQTGSSYDAYDAWGQRFEFLRLGKTNYTIRSFGEDGLQNRPNQLLDPGVFRWGPLDEKGLQYKSGPDRESSRPSVILFAGADDDSQRWHGKLFVDPVTGVRRLIVRDRRSPKFYMLAPHDGVEEFLWVPGREQIVFTASMSARYGDGFYLWDINRDEVHNLFELTQSGEGLDPGKREQGFHLSISGVTTGEIPKAAVFVESAQVPALNPHEFFSPQKLHVFELGETIRHILPPKTSSPENSWFNLEFLGTHFLQNLDGGNALQRSWLKLPMGGDWEQAVGQWQDFVTAHSKSVLAPYAVWGLSLFYAEAAQNAGLESQQGKVLRGYSKELSTALTRMPIAPRYIRAIGAWSSGGP